MAQDPLPAAGEPLLALLDVLRSFWPEADVGLDLATAHPDAQFRVVPDPARPRMLLPAGRREAAGSLWRFSAALSAKESAVRVASAVAARTVGPWVLGRHRLVVDGGGDSLATHLAGCLGHEVDFSVTIGTARANRKPILQVFDPRGRTVAFAKVGDSEVARGHVQGEVDALRALEGRVPAGIEIPRLLSVTNWRGQLVMLISPLPTTPQDRRTAWRIPRAEMDAFATATGRGSAPLPAVPQWQRMVADVASLPAESAATGLNEALDDLARLAESGGDLPVGCWHGDWTAWNMGRRRGRLQLWDFERFESGAVAGLDPFHYAVNTATQRRGTTVATVTDGLHAALAQVGDTRRNRLIAGIYAAAAAARYAVFTTRAGGQVVAERATVMADALTGWLPVVDQPGGDGR